MASENASEREKREDIIEVVQMLEGLSPVQVEVVRSIIKRFADEQESKLVRDDFLTLASFEYFTMRLAAHHAYSSSVLKKENFEHILEQAFRRSGVETVRAKSMTVRGADLTVGGVTLSLKTEVPPELRQFDLETDYRLLGEGCISVTPLMVHPMVDMKTAAVLELSAKRTEA